MHVHRVVARLRLRFPASRKMIYGVRCAPLLKKLRMFRTRIGGTEIDARVRSKRMRPSAARNGRQATSEYILYDANAGYQQTLLPVVTRPAKKTGLRSHRHHQHRRTGGSEPMERHETPDAVRSSAVKPGSSASAFGLRPALTLAPTAVSSRRPRSASADRV